jgi:hypothetical protein
MTHEMPAASGSTGRTYGVADTTEELSSAYSGGPGSGAEQNKPETHRWWDSPQWPPAVRQLPNLMAHPGVQKHLVRPYPDVAQAQTSAAEAITTEFATRNQTSPAFAAAGGGNGELFVGAVIMVGIPVGIAWVIHKVFGSWWSVPSVLGVIVLAAVAMRVLPRRLKRTAGALILLAGIAALFVVFVALPQQAQRRADAKLSAEVCDMSRQSSDGWKTATDYIDRTTRDHGGKADDRWAKIVKSDCPDAIHNEETTSPTTGAQATPPSVGDVLKRYGPMICQQLASGRSVQDMVQQMVASGAVNPLEAAALLGAAKATSCPDTGK